MGAGGEAVAEGGAIAPHPRQAAKGVHMNNISTTILIAGTIFYVVMMVLWLILPFALFGIKGRLDKIIRLMEQERAERERVEPRL